LSNKFGIESQINFQRTSKFLLKLDSKSSLLLEYGRRYTALANSSSHLI